ncbi:MAG: acetyltransferase [Candidatus Omnitrophota bacterium]
MRKKVSRPAVKKNRVKRIVIVGGGGHAKVVIDAARKQGGFRIAGVADPSLKKGSSIMGAPALGGDSVLPAVLARGVKYAFVGVGSVGDTGPRKKIYNALKRIGFNIPVIVHPASVIADDVELGDGTFVAAGAVINPGTRTGKNVIINTCASVDHDCALGDFAHIAPNAVLSGGVRIGEDTHVGVGATVIQNIAVGKRCLIKAGAVLTDSIGDDSRF